MIKINDTEFQHDKYCACANCEARLAAKVADAIDSRKWGVVTSSTKQNEYPNNFSARTYGIPELYNHKNIQLCLPMGNRRMLKIFLAFVEAITEGVALKPGGRYYGIIEEDITIECMAAFIKGVEVVRILIPTDNNDFEYPAYRAQFTKPEGP